MDHTLTLGLVGCVFKSKDLRLQILNEFQEILFFLYFLYSRNSQNQELGGSGQGGGGGRSYKNT